MKNIILLLFLSTLLSCSMVSYQTGYYGNPEQKPIYEQSFKDQSNLPYNLIISDKYLKEKNTSF